MAYWFGVSNAGPAQTGRIIGTVADSSGAPIAYANVLIIGTTHGAMSLEDGAYVIANVPAGSYQIVAQMKNTSFPEQSTVLVEAGKTTTVNITAIEVFPPPHPANQLTDIMPKMVADKIASADIVEYGLLCRKWAPPCDTLPSDPYLEPYRVRKFGGELANEDVRELKSILEDPESFMVLEGPQATTLCVYEPHIVYWFFKDYEASRKYDRVAVIVSSSCAALTIKEKRAEIRTYVYYAQDRLLDLLVRICPDDSLSLESYKLFYGEFPGPSN
jgi:hypothetical protein